MKIKKCCEKLMEEGLMEEGLMEEGLMEEGLMEEGSSQQRKCSEDLSEQIEKWIKKGKFLPLREWVKQELPEGLNSLNGFNKVIASTQEKLYVKIENRRIVHKIIGKEPNDFIKIILHNRNNQTAGVFSGDLPVKIWLNPAISQFELIEKDKMMEQLRKQLREKMCCNLF